MYRYYILIVLGCLLNINLTAQSVGGNTSGAASYCGSVNSGFIGLSGHTGVILDWESSNDGGTTWVSTGNTFTNQSYFNLSVTTCYRAIVQNGAFPPDTSTVSCVTIYTPTVPGTLSGDATYCGVSGAGSINLVGNIGNVLNWQSSVNGGATWTNIANTTTVLNYAGITQTTLYEAVVQNSTFCLVDTSSQATITILPPSVGGSLSHTANDTVCYFANNSAVTLSGNTGNVVSWISSTDNGANWTNISNITTTLNYAGLILPTMYAAIVQNGPCTTDTSAVIKVNLYPIPAPVNAGVDTTIQLGASAQLTGTGTGTPFWSPITGLTDPLIYNPVATPVVTTNYILYVTDANSCTNADTVVITVFQPKFTGFVSNYFSPNGDGVNDNWYIQDILLFPENEVFVYNIYGNEVYSKTAYANDWKGTYQGADLPDGTYYYVVNFTKLNTTVKGTLDILRKK